MERFDVHANGCQKRFWGKVPGGEERYLSQSVGGNASLASKADSFVAGETVPAAERSERGVPLEGAGTSKITNCGTPSEGWRALAAETLFEKHLVPPPRSTWLF